MKNELTSTLWDIGLAGRSQEMLAQANEGIDNALTEQDVDAYSNSYQRTLQKAQDRLGSRSFIPNHEGIF